MQVEEYEKKLAEQAAEHERVLAALQSKMEAMSVSVRTSTVVYRIS